MIEQLPPELAKLIAAERAAPVADHAMRALVRAKVAATVAGAPLGAAAGATAAAAAAGGAIGAGKIIAIIAVVLGAGTVAVVKSQQQAAPMHEHAAPVASAVIEAPMPSPLLTPVSIAEPVPPPAPPPPAPPPIRPHVVAAPQPSAPSQAELLQQAWAELGRADAASALDLVTRDEKLHADGALAEERAAVRILALAKLGREREALDENIEFTTKYPNSIHRDAIARALMGSAQ
jgi:type IV secretory pathway VirB10-like protein